MRIYKFIDQQIRENHDVKIRVFKNLCKYLWTKEICRLADLSEGVNEFKAAANGGSCTIGQG